MAGAAHGTYSLHRLLTCLAWSICILEVSKLDYFHLRAFSLPYSLLTRLAKHTHTHTLVGRYYRADYTVVGSSLPFPTMGQVAKDSGEQAET